MPLLADKFNCTSCTACETVCPKDAIQMEVNPLGFKHPKVNTDLCVECKLCERTCPIVSEQELSKNSIISVFAGQLIDHERLMESQSGGAFQAIATTMINSGYIVYGAAFNPDLTVSHHRVDSITDLPSLYKSKYVQSDLNGIFKNVINDLRNGKKVLFSGTPCQIAGLKRAIPSKFRENISTVDIICHGVPSPEVYRQYLQYQSKINNKEIAEFNFRDKKECGWRTPLESMLFKDGTKHVSYLYNFIFLAKDLISSQACANCRFSTIHREGDITIADCWGWENLGLNTFDESAGISLILINSGKGASILEQMSGYFKTIPVDISRLMQRNLSRPTERPKMADKVARDFQKHGFEYIHKKYGYTKWNLKKYRVKEYSKRGIIFLLYKICASAINRIKSLIK